MQRVEARYLTGVCVLCAGRHRVALLLAVHPAVDRSQRQGALQRSGVENAAAAGGGAFCSAHPATHAQVSGTNQSRTMDPTHLPQVPVEKLAVGREQWPVFQADFCDASVGRGHPK